jgi:hypothetical protein
MVKPSPPGTVGPFVYRIDPDSGKRYPVLAHYANSALPPLEAALVREAAPRPAAAERAPAETRQASRGGPIDDDPVPF